MSTESLVKASREKIAAFTERPDASTPCCLVRRVAIIVTSFGGLRYVETGRRLHHPLSRQSVQRSDKTATRFMIPRNKHGCNYAAVVENYFPQLNRNADKAFVNIYFFTLGGGWVDCFCLLVYLMTMNL